ncbi:MAG: hypothetical protein AAF291_14355 [Pseudomonadota bacterium]
MYSEDDINSAVEAGALDASAAESFRAYMSQVREMPRGSEENFRLINSFNDIFVSIGIVILLIAVGSIAASIGGLAKNVAVVGDLIATFVPAVAVAGASWALAEFFTRRRRMALPSILLLLTYLGGAVAAAFAVVALPIALILGIDSISETSLNNADIGDALGAAIIVLVAVMTGAFTTLAAYLHWKRFMVPITIAAGAGTLALVAILGIMAATEVITGSDFEFPTLILVLVAGLTIFAFAMRWDISDTGRTTRRSDVAFWLHCLAAPMIAHPLFASFGVMDGGGAVGVGSALAILAIYAAFGLVALAVDRRALLVSALAYVLAALTFLFDKFGAVELNFAFTALVIGSALLSLSAFWQPIRRRIVVLLPENLQRMLPATQDEMLPAASAAAQA